MSKRQRIDEEFTNEEISDEILDFLKDDKGLLTEFKMSIALKNNPLIKFITREDTINPQVLMFKIIQTLKTVFLHFYPDLIFSGDGTFEEIKFENMGNNTTSVLILSRKDPEVLKNTSVLSKSLKIYFDNFNQDMLKLGISIKIAFVKDYNALILSVNN